MESIQPVAIAALVVAMLFSVGLKLPVIDLLSVFSYKVFTLFAILFNIILFPVIVYKIGGSLALHAGVTTGLTLLAASPGGPTGPVFTRLAGGNLGYATGLMVTLSFLSVFSGPATVVIMQNAGFDLPVLFTLLKTLLVFQFIPLVAGMFIHRFKPVWAQKMAPATEKIANLLLILVIIGLLIAKGHLLVTMTFGIHLMMIGLVFAGLLSGYAITRTPEIRTAISQVTAVRNISIALLLSSAYFSEKAGPLVTTTILAFGFYTMVIPGLLAIAGAKKGRAETATPLP